MNKKYLPSALILYLNYFIHGIGCSILSQQVVKEMLANQLGLKDVMAVTFIAAALGLGRLISLPFAGPLSDKLGRRFSVIIGCASYVVFLVGIAFSPNTTIAYIAAVLDGIANSFLDTATYPAAAGGVLQMATAVVNNLFPKIKGTITSLVMIASSLCNYTILTAAAKMTSTSVIMMNIVITAIGILLALFVNVRYGVLLKNAEEASKN